MMKKKIIGIEFQNNGLYLQDNAAKVNDDNIFLEYKNFHENFSYKFRLNKTKDSLNFDNSYISAVSKNHIYTIGKINYWWSASDEKM